MEVTGFLSDSLITQSDSYLSEEINGGYPYLKPGFQE